MRTLLAIYRQIPHFRGKLRIGRLLFKRFLNKSLPEAFYAHDHIRYNIPNTLENLGVELYINGIYEKEIVEFLKAHVNDGAVFFDIGANIGSIGLPVMLSKKNVLYTGFEASPNVFNFLKKNFEENKVRYFTLCNKLVHEDSNRAMKFYEAELYGKSSLAPTYTDKSIDVKSISLDNYCEEQGIKKIDWLKVDVQGFELYVFKGMKEMLRDRCVENILFEFEAWADEQAGIETGAALKYLEEEGYVLFGIDGLPWKQSAKQKETMIWARPA